MKPRVLILIVLGLTALSSFGYAAQPMDSGEERLLVEILIFSGRPNPIFAINDPEKIREVMSMVRALPQHPTLKSGSGVSVVPSRLGFRGFRVVNLSKTSEEIQTFEVNNSDLRLRRKADSAASTLVEFRADNSKLLQRKLLEIGRSSGGIEDQLAKLIENSK